MHVQENHLKLIATMTILIQSSTHRAFHYHEILYVCHSINAFSYYYVKFTITMYPLHRVTAYIHTYTHE